MSQARIEQFYGKAVKDPALINRIATGTKSPEDFVRNAVQEGKNQGYEFSYEEADTWIKNQQKMKASGELSDSQLEGVAGGKASNTTSSGLAAQAWANESVSENPHNSFGTQVGAGFTGAGQIVGSWLTSW